MSIERVGIIGGGTMGAGIAEVCAVKELDVVLCEMSDDLIASASARIGRSLAKAVERGKLAEAARDEALEGLRFTTDLADMADRQLLVESVVEDEHVKAEVFSALDAIVTEPDAILASNTSSIPIMKLAMSTGRPHQVVGLHFFNPVPVMQLVEVVRSLATDEEVVGRVSAFVTGRLGKTVVQAPDRAGFIVNALLVPYLIDAVRYYEAGNASAEDIDTAMRLGANHPMGPLALCDLIGNDTMLNVAEAMYSELREPRLTPPGLLRRMVEAGRLGRKTGRGFFNYE